ncbi:MAG TPA: DUF3828 domain-containing protein [Blastocatellia bacterium]|nr:DUF3828 domain-containing protein [Blastocatellia bacterium]
MTYGRSCTVHGARAVVVVLALAVAAVVSPAAQGAAATPKQMVTTLYQYHFAHKQRWDLTFKRYRSYFSKDLLALFDDNDKRQAASPDEVVGLDFDPITDSQEEASGYAVTGVTSDGASAVVTVRVRTGTEHRDVRVQFGKEGAAWKITNVLYDEENLATILKSP